MSQVLSVGVGGAAARDFLATQRAVWATLPMSLTESASGSPQLVAVDGRQPDWLTAATEAAASAGVLGVLVVHPCPGPTGARLGELAARTRDVGFPVAVETPWASHPATAPLADAAKAKLSDVALVDSVAVVATDDPRSPAGLLLDQLALLRAVLGPIDEMALSVADKRGHTVNARCGTGAIALSAVRSSSSRAAARMSVYSMSGEAHIEIPADGTAAPARASLVDEFGESFMPTWYESASRASWRQLIESVTTPRALSHLDWLADDLGLVASMTERAGSGGG